MIFAPLSALLQPTLLDCCAVVQQPCRNTSTWLSTTSSAVAYIKSAEMPQDHNTTSKMSSSLAFLPPASRTLQEKVRERASQPASHPPVPQYPSLAPPTRIKPVHTSTALLPTTHMIKVISVSSDLYSHKP